MTVAPRPVAPPADRLAPSDERGRRRRRLVGSATVALAVALAAPGAAPEPAGAAGLLWDVRFAAPLTAAGPNAVRAVPEVAGTARPPILGNPTRVTYAVAVPAGFPAACAVPSGTATLAGPAFRFRPAMACNGTYTVSVVARAVSIPPDSPRVAVPLALADPGPAPAGVSGSVAGSQVSLSWTPDADPDVVGYRIRRDGQPVTDLGAGASSFTGEAPVGRSSFDVLVLRWGAGGPGSASLASPASAPFVAEVAAPPGGGGTDGGETPVGGGGGGSPTDGAGDPTDPGGSGGSGGSGGATGSPGGGAATGGSGRFPSAGSGGSSWSGGSGGRSSSGSSTRYRPGGSAGTAGSSSSAAEVDTYEERLPYEGKDTGRTVEVAGPDTTRTVRRTVVTPGTERPGLLVPIAVVLVLVAASLQIRAFLHRTAPATVRVGGPPKG